MSENNVGVSSVKEETLCVIEKLTRFVTRYFISSYFVLALLIKHELVSILLLAEKETI